jgi:hypothetical protein
MAKILVMVRGKRREWDVWRLREKGEGRWVWKERDSGLTRRVRGELSRQINVGRL